MARRRASGPGSEVRDLERFGQVVRCGVCQSQANFCQACSEKFEAMVPEWLRERIAFGDERAEFQAMYDDLSRRVEDVSRANRRTEVKPMTSVQRDAASQRMLKCLDLSVITHNIQKDKINAGLLMHRNPLDVLPRDVVACLAGIDDDTRSWIKDHDTRIRERDSALSNDADRDIARQHKTINLHHRFMALDVDYDAIQAATDKAHTFKLIPNTPPHGAASHGRLLPSLRIANFPRGGHAPCV